MAGLGYGVINPYGAVPEALKDLRLSISDIMGNLIKSKELDNAMALEQAKGEVAKEGILAGVRKMEIEAGLKKQEAEIGQERWGKEFGLKEAEHGLNIRKVGVLEKEADIHEREQANRDQKLPYELDNLAAETGLKKATARHYAALDASINEDLKQKRLMGSEKTIGEWADRWGVSKGLLATWDLNPDAKVTGAELAPRIREIITASRSTPELPLTYATNNMKDSINKLMAEYRATGDVGKQQTILDQINATSEKLGKSMDLIGVMQQIRRKDLAPKIEADYIKLLENPKSDVWITDPSTKKKIPKPRDVFAAEYIDTNFGSLYAPVVRAQRAVADLNSRIAENQSGYVAPPAGGVGGGGGGNTGQWIETTKPSPTPVQMGGHYGVSFAGNPSLPKPKDTLGSLAEFTKYQFNPFQGLRREE